MANVLSSSRMQLFAASLLNERIITRKINQNKDAYMLLGWSFTSNSPVLILVVYYYYGKQNIKKLLQMTESEYDTTCTSARNGYKVWKNKK